MHCPVFYTETGGLSAGVTIVICVSLRPRPQPADLDTVRASYDLVADNYVEMVTTTGIGDIRVHPWLNAAIDYSRAPSAR